MRRIEEEREALTKAKEIVLGYQKALGKEDWQSARRFLHDDLSFKGPIAAYDTPEPYLEDLKKLHPVVKGVDVKKMFVDGDDVCLLYDLITNTPAGTAFVSEWYHVKGDKIGSIRVVFDARPFAPMFTK
jgi:hypothetical protein